MRKISLIGLAAAVFLAGAALWARQQAAGTPVTPAQIEQRVVKFLRDSDALGSEFQVTAEAPAPSPIPDVYKVTVTITYKGQSEHGIVYVSHDGKYMLNGPLSNLLIDPFAAARAKLQTALDAHPYVGPTKACVNVVEFSDYECPHCREAQQMLDQLETKYPTVRFTFVNFPLAQIHPWAMDAALASRCAYDQNPAAFSKIRTAIFNDQDNITPDNAITTLGTIATQAGLNASTLKACIATPAAHEHVEHDLALGKDLGVDATPTFFINGRPIVGLEPGNEPAVERVIGYEQAKCGPRLEPGPTRK